MGANLSFEQAPPFSVPLRFFLTAPLFGIAAGLLLIFSGGDGLPSRWHPLSLALTHLMVAGFLLQVMAGALFQFVPVVTGGNVRWPRLTSGLIHPALTLGAGLLALAFLRSSPGLFVAAAFALGGGVLGLVVVIGAALVGSRGRGETLTALRGAVAGLCAAGILGMSLAFILGGHLQAEGLRLLEAHQAWGLGGWALLLLAGVSWSVVPMFQLTPHYPQQITRGFPLLMFAALIVLSTGLVLELTAAIIVGKSLLVLAAAIFAAGTLQLQARRKRKVSDDTLIFFRVAMVVLLMACVLGLPMLALSVMADQPQWPLTLGLLLIVGGFGSAVCGMLYKIVPFLVWLHLRNLTPLGVQPPTMNRMIAAKHSRRQLWAHLAALVLLLSLPWLPRLAPVAGIALTISFCALWFNLLSALRIYRRFIQAKNSD